jgi:universal stress protein A
MKSLIDSDRSPTPRPLMRSGGVGSVGLKRFMPSGLNNCKTPLPDIRAGEVSEMAFPYRKILCPIDFDDNSLTALERAAEFARYMDSILVLLHVLPIIITPGQIPPPLSLYEDQRKAAEAKLASIAREKLAGLHYELHVEVGDVIGTIAQVENRLQPDLLVMATHGRRGLTRMFLGSVAEGVLRRATCPVLTIREEVHR